MTLQKQTSNFAPLAFVGMMFFAIGFALGINSFLIPVINSTLGVSSAQAYLVLAATFSTFIIFGYPASMTIKKIGYKQTMALSFMFFAVGFLLYVFSAKHNNFVLFLVASFMSGIGNTFLQASVNPYITILGPIESAARRMSIMGISNKLAWPIAPVFLAWVIGKNTTEISEISDLILPFYIIIGVFILLGVISLLAPLPEVKAVGEDDCSSTSSECAYAAEKTSIWQFPHLILGVIALFLYVGAEVIALSTLVDYATNLKLPNAANYAWIPSVGMVVGYICGIITIPKFISQAKALRVCASIAIAGTICVVLSTAANSIWFISLIALGCSLMWPALWPLAMADLGKFTKAGASLLVMAIAGGAVVPLIFGFIKDIVGTQSAYWVCLPCFLFILYYGLIGYKIRTK
ncbi:MAG: glucose/galactose MFS transporter [Mariniphaga sp.]|jgi:MFS transporter, FHS family, L-fucose permease